MRGRRLLMFFLLLPLSFGGSHLPCRPLIVWVPQMDPGRLLGGRDLSGGGIGKCLLAPPRAPGRSVSCAPLCSQAA